MQHNQSDFFSFAAGLRWVFKLAMFNRLNLSESLPLVPLRKLSWVERQNRSRFPHATVGSVARLSTVQLQDRYHDVNF